jgi:hypothetical protein
VVHQHDNVNAIAAENYYAAPEAGLSLGTPGTIPCPTCGRVAVFRLSKGCSVCHCNPSEIFEAQELRREKDLWFWVMLGGFFGAFVLGTWVHHYLFWAGLLVSGFAIRQQNELSTRK